MSGKDITATQPDQNRSFYRKPIEGEIISVTPVIALVRPIGSFHPIPCEHDLGSGSWVGKRCTVVFVPQRKKYVIQSVFGAPQSVVSPDQNPTAFELSPPSNLAHDDALPNCIHLVWDCPPQQDITFEVQYNASASESGATSRFTRGGEIVIETADDPTWFRIRSISVRTQGEWRYSSWTAWGSESPGTGAAGGGDGDAIHDNVAGEIHAITEETTPADDDEFILESAANSYAKRRVKKSNLVVAGGSGSLVTVGNYADSRPSTPSSGDRFIPKDGYWDEIYHDAQWNAWRNNQILIPPPTTGWSWYNQGSSSVDSSKGPLLINAPILVNGSTAFDIHGYYRTLPSTPYVVTAAFKHLGQSTAGLAFGLGWTDGTKITGIEATQTNANISVLWGKWTNATTPSGGYTVSGGPSHILGKDLVWLRIEDDGTDFLVSVGLDGKVWNPIAASVSRTDFLTPSDLIIYIYGRHASLSQTMRLLVMSWEVS